MYLRRKGNRGREEAERQKETGWGTERNWKLKKARPALLSTSWIWSGSWTMSRWIASNSLGIFPFYCLLTALPSKGISGAWFLVFYPMKSVCHILYCIRNSQYLGLLRAILTSTAVMWNSYWVLPFTATQASGAQCWGGEGNWQGLVGKNSTCLHFQLILEMTFTARRKPKKLG